ncbi:MAG TPA: PIG-L family deacetylase [Verrucomicrobiae bacterium]|nr:PIG-L family deacetylase [Verrucomicrobiae bacterium]
MTSHWSQLLFSNATAPRMAVVAAYPAAEVIGAGVQLRRWSHAQVVHVTDGAPRNSVDVWRAGFVTSEEYASFRQREAITALALTGIQVRQLHPLGFAAQETTLNLVSLTETMVDKLLELQPQVVLTHAYEGGHPDNDATAFAVHTACAILQQELGVQPLIVEFAGYFNRAGIMATGEFLPRARQEVVTRVLTPAERQFKQQLFACCQTQRDRLQYFPIGHERFRLAPVYDFAQAPHPGKLHYELFEWGTTGERWRKLAGAALRRFTEDDIVASRLAATTHESHTPLCN